MKNFHDTDSRIRIMYQNSIKNILDEKYQKQLKPPAKIPDEKTILNLKRIMISIKKIPDTHLRKVLELIIKKDISESTDYILNHYR